jgi:hypothetical protein
MAETADIYKEGWSTRKPYLECVVLLLNPGGVTMDRGSGIAVLK